MQRPWLGLVVLSLLLAARPASAEDSLSLENLEALKAATVFLKVDVPGSSARGSGFVIRTEAGTTYIVTNSHVVEPDGRPGRVTAVLRSGTAGEQSLPAETIASDPRRDLAVVRVLGVHNPPAPVDLSKPAQQVETTPVFIFGFPLGELLSADKGNPAITVGKGSVSSIRLDAARKVAAIQVAGDLTPGNSGGPVVDADGRLVGVAVATVRNRQIGFTVPREQLTALLQGMLLDFHFAQRATDPGACEVTVELGLFDPLGKLRSAELYFLRADRADGKKLAGLPGVEKVELRREQQMTTGKFALTGKFTLAMAGAGETPILFQTVSVNGDGKTYLRNPRVQRFRPTGGVSPAPPVPMPPMPPVVAPGATPDKDAIARLLTELRTDDKGRRTAAADQLSTATPGEGKEEVVKELESLMGRKDLFARTSGARVYQALIRAYIVWAGKDGVRKLYEELAATADFRTRNVVIEGLSKLDGAKAAEAIAKYLPDHGSRETAAKALTEMGSAGEKAVLPYLSHSDWGVRSRVSKILETVGTAEALDALKNATSDSISGRHAQAAIDAINIRVMKK